MEYIERAIMKNQVSKCPKHDMHHGDIHSKKILKEFEYAVSWHL